MKSQHIPLTIRNLLSIPNTKKKKKNLLDHFHIHRCFFHLQQHLFPCDSTIFLLLLSPKTHFVSMIAIISNLPPSFSFYVFIFFIRFMIIFQTAITHWNGSMRDTSHWQTIRRLRVCLYIKCLFSETNCLYLKHKTDKGQKTSNTTTTTTISTYTMDVKEKVKHIYLINGKRLLFKNDDTDST